MPNTELIALANTVLAQIKSEITVETDIISDAALHHSDMINIFQYRQQFGEENFSLYCQLNIKLKLIKRFCEEEFTNKPQSYPDAQSAKDLIKSMATALCKTGGSHEFIHYAIYLLVQQGYKGPIYIVTATDIEHHAIDTHNFLLLGNPHNNFNNPLNVFGFTQTAATDCVLFDPFLGFVDSAANASTLLSPYFNRHNIIKLYSVKPLLNDTEINMVYNRVFLHAERMVSNIEKKMMREMSATLNRVMGNQFTDRLSNRETAWTLNLKEKTITLSSLTLENNESAKSWFRTKLQNQLRIRGQDISFPLKGERCLLQITNADRYLNQLMSEQYINQFIINLLNAPIPVNAQPVHQNSRSAPCA